MLISSLGVGMNLFSEISPSKKIITSSDGERLAYRVMGDLKDPVVMLIHGHSMESRMCTPLVLPYSDKYCFILPDIRGFGSSSPYIADPEDVLATFAEDMEKILSTNGIEEIAVVGISFGSLIAMEMMKRNIVGVKKALFIDHSMKPLNTPGRKTGFCPDTQEIPNFMSKMISAFRREVGLFQNGRWTYRRDADYENMSEDFKKAYSKASKSTMLSAINPHLSKLLGLSSNRYLRKINPMYRSWYTTMLLVSSFVENQYDYKKFLRDTDIPYDLYWGKETKMFHSDALKDYEDIQQFNKGDVVKFDAGHDLFITKYTQFIKEFKTFLDK